MFAMLPNFWTPVLPVAEIENTPVAVELAGERLVLFRNDGKIGVLLDRCPHRGVALSLGRISNDGCLECPYHGWQFAHDGACTQVPLNDSSKIDLSKLSAVSLPTQIIAGLVWVFTGQGDAPELQLPDSLMQPQQSYVIHHEVWNAHWTRVMENAMDYVHVPFVHRNSFGGEIGELALKASSIAEIQIEQAEHSVQVFNRYHNMPSGFTLEWHEPNVVALKFDESGIPVRSHLFGIPINEQQTRLILAILILDCPEVQSKDAFANEFIQPLVEDQVVIESQRGEVPSTTGECNVPTDKATLLFRRWYHQTIVRAAVSI